MLKSKRTVSVILILSFLMALIPIINPTIAHAEVLTAQNNIVILDAGSSIEDTSYIDTTSTNSSTIVDFYGSDFRCISGLSSITYLVDLPDNAINISFNAYGDGFGTIDVSKDKNTWVSSTASTGSGLNAYEYIPLSQEFLSGNAAKTIYIKVSSATKAASWIYGSFFVRYEAFGEEPTGASSPFSSIINVGKIEEKGRLYEKSADTYIGLSPYQNDPANYFQRNIWGAGYVDYRLDLPNHITSFTINSLCWGSMKVSISRDNTNWTQTFNSTIGSPADTVIGTDSSGNFLSGNFEKVIFVRIETTNTAAIVNLKYTVSATSNSSVFYKLDVGTTEETVRIHDKSADSYIGLTPYQNDPTHYYQRNIWGSGYLVYKLDMPDNTVSFTLSALCWGSVKATVLTANSDWNSTFTGTVSSASNVQIGSSSDADYLSNNASKTIYVKIETVSSAAVVSLEYTATISTNPTYTAVFKVASDVESRRIVQYSGDTNAGAALNGDGDMQRNIWGSGFVVYRLDLPDLATDFSINALCWGAVKVSLSLDKTNWIQTFLNSNTTAGTHVVGTDTDLDIHAGNKDMVIFMKIESTSALALTRIGYTVTVKSDPPSSELTLPVGTNMESSWIFLDDSYLSTYNGGFRRDLTGTKSMVYKFNLPDNTRQFSVSLSGWGAVKASFSSDNATWTETYNQSLSQLCTVVIGTESSGSFLSTGKGPYLYVKIEAPVSAMVMLSITMNTLYGGSSRRTSTTSVSDNVTPQAMETNVSNLFTIATADLGITYNSNTLYCLDLKSIIDNARASGVSDKILYDTVNLVATLQGIVNRTDPHLFLDYVTNSALGLSGNPDEYWLSYLTGSGRYLYGKTIVNISSIGKIVDMFKNVLDSNGAVVWDPEVVATSNVASTISGVDDLVPVRYDTGLGVYDWFIRRNPILSVQKNLCGLFTGSGTIPETSMQSTGSKKCDAYLWAKDNYLDAGLTSTTIMTYVNDAYSWNHNYIWQIPAYTDLENTGLVNKDYFIAKRAFFFDLSVWPDQSPNDDYSQTPGTDYNTLCSILSSQNELANGNVITIGGFIPWFLKYTNAINIAFPNAIRSEWQMGKVVSTYYAQTDADIFKALSNCSIYSNIPLNTTYTQNTKSVTATLGNKNYLCFYMGDYDSSAYTGSLVSQFWNDSARGQIPLAWGVNTSLADRIPHVLDYMYTTKSAKDYFVMGDNGTGYLNVLSLTDSSRPSTLLGSSASWIDHNQDKAAQFDLDISGYSIFSDNDSIQNFGVGSYNYDQTSCTSEFQDIVRQIAPVGSGISNNPSSRIMSSTPAIKVVTAADASTDANYTAGFINGLTGNVAGSVASPENFGMYRMIWSSPTKMKAVYDKLCADYPGKNYELVDPYTFFELYKQSVQRVVTGVSVTPSSLTVGKGSTGTLTAGITPANANNTNVAWSSSNTSVATVDTNGIVTGITPGTATITATTQDGGFTSSCSVTVKRYDPSKYYKITYDSNSTLSIDATNTGINGVVKNVTYSGADSQKWQILETTDSNTFKFVNKATGYALKVNSTTNSTGKQIIQTTYASANNMNFTVSDSSTYSQIVSKLGSSTYIKSTGSSGGTLVTAATATTTRWDITLLP